MINCIGIDGSLIEGVLRKYGIDPEGVDADFVLTESVPGRRDQENGLDYILEHASSGRPIVMMSLSGKMIVNDSRFQGAMGYPNVAFCEGIPSGERIVETLREAESPSRPKDELAIELAGREMPQRAIAILKHDLPHAIAGNKSDDDKAKLMAMGKELFGLEGEVTLEELLERAQNTDGSDFKAPFEGRELSGIFVDVEGTLLQDNLPNHELIDELRERAKTTTITIWTDGDIDAISARLRDEGILWKIVPKDYFQGTSVEEIYDDLSEEELETKFGIKSEIYNQVQPPQSRETLPGAVS